MKWIDGTIASNRFGFLTIKADYKDLTKITAWEDSERIKISTNG
jgi:hypothetical protein